MGQREGRTHLDIPSYQVGRLFVRLQGNVDGGERTAGHLLHLSQQLLGSREEDDEEHGRGQGALKTSLKLSLTPMGFMSTDRTVCLNTSDGFKGLVHAKLQCKARTTFKEQKKRSIVIIQ